MTTNNVANTTYEFVYDSATTSSWKYYLYLYANDGYIFDENNLPSVIFRPTTSASAYNRTFIKINDTTICSAYNGSMIHVPAEDSLAYCTISGSVIPVATTYDVTNNVTNTSETHTYDATANTGVITLTCADGYEFADVPVASYDSIYGEYQTINGVISGNVATFNLVDVDDTITVELSGNTTPVATTYDVTNNVANTSETHTYDSTANTGVITLTCADGYEFADVPVATYTDIIGDYNSVNGVVSGNVATFDITNVDDTITVTLTGNTKVITTDINIINNITGTTVTHTYNDTTKTATITATATGTRQTFTAASVTYTDTNGDVQTVNMNITTVGTATVSITDVDANHDVTLNGNTARYTTITNELSNCSVSGIESYYFADSVINITAVANNNCEFKETELPVFAYYDNNGDYNTINFTFVDANNVSFNLDLSTIDFDVDNTAHNFSGGAQPISVVTNYGAINVYVVDMDVLSNFANARFFYQYDTETGTLIEAIDLGKYVNRIKRIYADVPVYATDVIKCGNYNTNVACHTINTDVITLNFGDVDLPYINNDAVDYESTYQLYLPFVGYVDLSTELIGNTINLTVDVNVVTGDALAKISCGGIIHQTVDLQPCTDILYQTTDTETIIGGDTWDARNLYGMQPHILVKSYDTMTTDLNNTSTYEYIGDMNGYFTVTDVIDVVNEYITTDERNDLITLLNNGVMLL